ncbi:MAG: hypothetical protein K2O00_03050 [Muribaculaceae bacterium]|nr:hypothetical protein [Muribaculaceae bacterium]
MNTPHKNLRFDADTHCFTPTKSVRKFSDSSLTPLLRLPHGNMLLCHSGTHLYILDTVSDTVVMTFDTSARILAAVLCHDTLCTVFLSTGQMSLHYSGTCWTAEPPTEFPEARITRIAATFAESSVASRKLSGTYSLTSHSLNATDSAAFTADLIEAYTSLRNSADAAGMFIQPVIARCRYLDTAGNTIFVTPPVMVTSPNGFQCTSPVTTLIEPSDNSRGAVTLSADTFKLQVNFPATSCSRVVKVIVEATPQLDIVDFNGKSVAAVMRGADGGLTVRGSLPVAPSTAEGKRRLTDSLLAHTGSLFRTVAVVSAPFNGTAHSITTGPDTTGATDLRTAVTSLRKTLSSAPSFRSSGILAGESTVPHSVTCGCVAANGDTLLMGNLTMLPFRGYRLDSFGASITTDSWKAAIAVEFAGSEEKVVRYCEGSGGAPVMLSPVISYPRADAVRMTIFFRTAGKCYRSEFPLTPSLCGDAAFYVSPDLKPIDLTADEADFFIVPAEIPVEHLYSGMIAAAPAASPSVPYAFRLVSSLPVTAVTHALGSSAGWDYVRSRFYLFSPEGAFTVITDSASIRGVNKVDSRGVSNSENIIPVTRNGVAVLTDSGDLLLWRGIAPRLAGRNLCGAIAFDAVHNELWLFGDTLNLSGDASAELPFAAGVAVERTFPHTPLHLFHTPGGTIIISVDGLYLLGDESCDVEQVDVRFFRSFPIQAPVKGVSVRQRARGKRLRGAKLLMQSPGPLSLTVSIRGDRGAGHLFSPECYRFLLEGSVNAPLLFHTPAPHFHRVYLTAEGSVPSGSSFTDFEIITEPYGNF